MYFADFVSRSVSEKDHVFVFFIAMPVEKESPTLGHPKCGTGS